MDEKRENESVYEIRRLNVRDQTTTKNRNVEKSKEEPFLEMQKTRIA